VIALAATPARSPSCTEDVFERFYLAVWASLLHVMRPEEAAGGPTAGLREGEPGCA
jgi:hypothetical protein